MKICFVADSMDFGGAERVTSTLCNFLCSKGVDVSLVCFSSKDKPSFNLNEEIVYTSLYSNNHLKLVRLLRLRNFFKKGKFDVVISFLPHITVYSYFALKGLKTKFIVSERANPKRYSWVMKKMLKKCFKKSDGAVFQTEDARNFYSCKNNKIILNPLPINFPVFEKHIYLDKTIVNVGSLQPIKNQLLLIDSFGLFLKSHPGFILKIYGKGTLRSELEKRIQELHLTDSIHILNPNPNWYVNEKYSTCFVLSSISEGLPNVLIESLCANIPSVSTDCENGGARQLISHTHNGLIVPNGDKEALCDAISFIADNKPEYDNSELIKTCSVENVGNIWLNYIKEIMEH